MNCTMLCLASACPFSYLCIRGCLDEAIRSMVDGSSLRRSLLHRLRRAEPGCRGEVEGCQRNARLKMRETQHVSHNDLHGLKARPSLGCAMLTAHVAGCLYEDCTQSAPARTKVSSARPTTPLPSRITSRTVHIPTALARCSEHRRRASRKTHESESQVQPHCLLRTCAVGEFKSLQNQS